MYVASAALSGSSGHHKYYMKPYQMYDGGGVKEICFNFFLLFLKKNNEISFSVVHTYTIVQMKPP